MKKNRTMKIVAFLFAATLISTSIVSEVFAKYTSSSDSSNTATVAQWGVVTSAEGSLFNGKDSNGNNIVFPGDQNPGNGLSLGINGTPAVDGEISFYIKHQNVFLKEGVWGIMIKAENVTSENYTPNTYYTFDGVTYTKDDNSTFNGSKVYYILSNETSVGASGYWPVVFKMKGDGAVGYEADETSAIDTNTLEGVVSVLTGVLENKTFKANDNLTNDLGLNNQYITWKWDNCQDGCEKYEISIVDGESGSVCDICKYDTILQNLIALNSSGTVHVVKKTSDTTYSSPVASTANGNYADGDYNLNVSFDLMLAIKQADR